MHRRLTYIAILLPIILTGCNKTVSEIGSGFIAGEPFDVASVDTITVRTSTVLYDSLATSQLSRLLVGHHDDEKLGPVTSYGVFQIAPPTANSLDPNSTTFTALSLHLIRDGYFYYDTTEDQTLSVYQLTKKIQLFGGFLFNVDHFTIDPSAPLGSLTFSPRPHDKDSVEIYLSDDLGRQLMHMAQFNDVALASTAGFISFFNGLVLVPDSSNSRTLLGFKTLPQMRLYYRDYATVPPANPDKYLSFTIGGGAIYYNKMYSNRSATKLASLKLPTDILASSATDHEMYIQGGVGLATRIEFPYIRNLLFFRTGFLCTKTILQLFPVQKIGDTTTPLPAIINLSVINNLNQIQVANYARAGLFTDQAGNTSYSVDITSFINGQLQIEMNNNNALLLQLPDPDFRATANRVYLGDGSLTNFQMKLTVYYITLEGASQN